MELPLGYSKLAKYAYHDSEDRNAKDKNRTIERILKKHKVKTVLDLTCGAGSQIFYLAKRGYKVTGSDFSPALLKIARARARKERINVKILQGDMRTIKVGKFDAVITIFNAVGHLTKAGFEKAMRNIHKNLNLGGIYVFDIYNTKCWENDVMVMDRTKMIGNIKFRDVQYSKLNKNGRLWSYDRFSIQKGDGKPKILKGKFVLQGYTAKELRKMLTRNGFKVLNQYAFDGSKFSQNNSESILTVAKKQKK